MAFPFEDLEVYKRSIELVTHVEALIEREKRRISRSLADQFSRAALSVPLNIAEGNGYWKNADSLDSGL